MRQVFLIAGFNNWGKTKLIQKAFDTDAFRKKRLYPLPGTDREFMVMPYSNDDLGLRNFVEAFEERLLELAKVGHEPKRIVSAFCPTAELQAMVKGGSKDSDSRDLITRLFAKDDVHMLLLKYKWCMHAELRPADIKSFYKDLPNVKVTTIDDMGLTEKVASVVNVLNAGPM